MKKTWNIVLFEPNSNSTTDLNPQPQKMDPKQQICGYNHRTSIYKFHDLPN